MPKSENLQSLFDQIEQEVLARNEATSLRLMARYRRLSGKDGTASLQILEWYRRLGLYREAFRLCSRHLKDKTHLGDPKTVKRLYFWAALLYDYLGVGALALDFARNSSPHDARDYHILADIFASDGEFSDARKNYEEAIRLETEPLSRKARLARIGLAEALLELDEAPKAIELMQRELTLTEDPAALGVIYRCLGKFHARLKQFETAHEYLLRCQKFIPAQDRTTDRAIWLKWWGYTLAKLGQVDQGLKAIDESERLLQELNIRPVAIFDVRLLRHEIVPLGADEIRQIRGFPGLPRHFLNRLPILADKRRGELDGAEWVLDLQSDEYGERISTEIAWKFGLPLELKFLALLKLARPFGVPRLWCVGLLWPDEPLSLLQLESRLDQLIIRLKEKYRFQVESNGTQVSLPSAEWGRLDVIRDGSNTPRLLRVNPKPSHQEVAQFYHVNRAQAYRYLKAWGLGAE